jgi:hypothetical protein
MKGVLSWLVRWACFVPPLGFSSQSSRNIFVLHRTLFSVICPNCPARWAGSNAGSIVSYTMCLCCQTITAAECRRIQMTENFKDDTNIWSGCFVQNFLANTYIYLLRVNLYCSIFMDFSYQPCSSEVFYAIDKIVGLVL